MGFRVLPHTADVRIEAWGSSRERCLAEAVVALVSTFVEPSERLPDAHHETTVTGDAERVLVGVLEEVVYLVEVRGVVPIRATVEAVPDGVRVRYETVPIPATAPAGAAPKAVTRHDLFFGPSDQGWTARVTIDV